MSKARIVIAGLIILVFGLAIVLAGLGMIASGSLLGGGFITGCGLMIAIKGANFMKATPAPVAT